MTVYDPAADGVNESRQNAIPAVPLACSVQLAELPNDPVVGELVKPTVPVGVVAPLDAVSLTATVHVVAVPSLTEPGEHATAVAVESIDGAGALPVAVIDEDSPLLS